MLSSNRFPASFVPQVHHVIIGRGRVTKMHSGNRRFDKLISDIKATYLAASNKTKKGNILTRLVNQVHQQAPDAGFIKRDPTSGRWIRVEETLARQAVAQALRNALSNKYTSSKQFKSKKRSQQIAMEKHRKTVIESYSLPAKAESTTASASVAAADTPPASADTQHERHNNCSDFVFGINLKTDLLCDSQSDRKDVGSTLDDALLALTELREDDSCLIAPKKLFSVLVAELGNHLDNADPTDDPFEPRPIASWGDFCLQDDKSEPIPY